MIGRITELVGFVDHAAEELSDATTERQELIGFSGCKILTINGRFNPMLGFLLFTIGVSEFANKMFFITTFSPCFSNISANRS